MIEAAILLFIATGSAVMIARHWQPAQQAALPVPAPRDLVSTIAPAGLYSITRPGENAPMSAFADLHLVRGGLSLRPVTSPHEQVIDFGQIQWVSAVQLAEGGVADILLHVEIDERWRIVTLRLPEAEMALLAKVLRKVIPASRNNIGHPAAPPLGPIPARYAQETLQGETTLGADVSLYLLPHMLIVLAGSDRDRVHARLDTSSIRRVLAVEQMPSGTLDKLTRIAPDGIVRLYSLHETASFALAQYRDFADEISYLSHCAVEHIYHDDKARKA